MKKKKKCVCVGGGLGSPVALISGTHLETELLVYVFYADVFNV